MPKQVKKIEDFSGGASGYFDPQKIQDTDLAQCSGFKPEPGELFVLGDMKAAYTIGSGDTAAAENISIEAGYGLFAFSHDYDRDGDLATTNYIALQNGNNISIYDDTDHTWVKVTGDTYTFADADPDTIADSGDGFIAAGFLPGMTILVSGSGQAANNKTHIIDIVTAGLLTLTVESELTADSGAPVTIIGYHIDLGGSRADNQMASIKPCFVFIDGTLRISPGNFDKVLVGTTLTTVTSGGTSVFEYGDVTSDAAGVAGKTSTGDTLEVEGMEFIVLFHSTTTTLRIGRNMTGLFPSDTSGTVAMSVRPDTRWFGLCKRSNFQGLTTIGTFTDWYGTFMHPRPPVDDFFTDIKPFTIPFITKQDTGTLVLETDTPMVGIAHSEKTNADATWDSTYNVWITALYDDSKQESQPNLVVSKNDVASGNDWNFFVGVSYSDDGTNYQINKRVTGARLYYEDEINERGILYQLLEIDFEFGCKNAESEKFTPWVEYTTANRGACCPHIDGAEAANRDNATDCFIFTHPPRVFTYEINTGYPANTNTHARFKTAVVANRRLYAGNIYHGGRAYGDRMLRSPVNKFDLLPEINTIDVAIGDGDEIVKLETFADRILQFKKRTLYLINVGGDYEFLESEHSNMGVENPSQVCKTEYGIAWVNKFGVYLYDGQSITELTRGKLKTVDTTAATSSQELGRARALNVTESNIPLIGYHSLKKWIIVHPESTVSDSYDVVAWIYDFKNGSWTWSQEFSISNDKKTNMVSTHDNELVFAGGTGSDTPTFYKLQDGTNDPAANKLFLLTKDFTLDVPSVKKNIYSVYVTYSVGGDTNLEADLIYKHSTGETTVAMQEASGSTYYDDSVGFKSTSSEKITIELVPSSAVSNANSFQFKISNPDGVHDVSDDFILYSISFRYRTKGIH